MRSITLRVDWLGISKNKLKGTHWSVYNKHKKAARIALGLALSHQYGKQDTSITPPVKITFRAFHSKGAKVYDKINYADCFKMLEDSLVDLEIIPDDRNEFVAAIEIQSGVAFKDWWTKGLPKDSHIMLEILSLDLG